MKSKIIILLTILSCALTPAHASETLDIPEIVLEHMSDSYEWHVFTYEGKHYSIPLPIILRSSTTGEWYVGSEHHLPAQYFFNEERHGKIYEHTPAGDVRPLDLSITKAVAQIWIVVIVLLAIFLPVARWYKGKTATDPAPKGFVGAIEMIVMMIQDDVIKSAIGEKHYKPYAPYLLTVFFFILTTNLVGLLPVFPGGANVTGNINVTLFLALCTMLAVNLFGNKEYWREILWPPVPMALKCPVPLLPVIELTGVFTKPFALMIRLFANMMAGHAVILSFTCVIFLGWSLGVAYGVGLNLFAMIMLLFANCLEFLVAFVQAYVFTLLSSVFIGLAHVEHHH